MTSAFRLRLLILPLLVLAVLVGWTGYWFYAQARAESEIDRAAARLEAQGGAFDCSDRQWQGFPLRLSMTCDGTRLDLPGGPLVETERLQATAHLHDPRRIVAHSNEVAVDAGEGRTLHGRDIVVVARFIDRDRLAFSAAGEDLSFADGRMPEVSLSIIEVEGRIENMPDSRSGDLAALLREAARVGSQVTIDRFEARMDDIRLTASGTVELSPEGPQGTLSTTVTNYEGFLAELKRRGAISGNAVQASSMVIGFLQGGRKKSGEVTVALRFNQGKVFWGPFAVAEIPPLH
jgi:hypothetical protein